MKKIELIFLLSIAFCSCNKKNENTSLTLNSSKPTNSVVSAFQSQNYPDPGLISYYAWGTASTSGNEVLFDGHAEFFPDSSLTGQVENVGTVNFGIINIDTNVTRFGTHDYNFIKPNCIDPNNYSNWGINSNFGISGGGTYAPFQANFYVPEIIYLTPIAAVCNISSLNYPTISKSNPTTVLNWNIDPNNAQVAIIFNYDGARSSSINSGLSSTSFSTYAVGPDNGTYSVSIADLSAFPVGGILDVYVGRGNDENVISNGKEVYVTANTYSKRTYMITN
jgi:hypothetical protein